MGLEFGTFNLGINPVAEAVGSAEFNAVPVGKPIFYKSGYFALADEEITLHTVTAGKILYVKQILFRPGTLVAGSGHVKFGDAASGAVTIDTLYSDSIILIGASDANYILTFPIPLKCTTSLIAATDSTITETLLGFVGWEEII